MKSKRKTKKILVSMAFLAVLLSVGGVVYWKLNKTSNQSKLEVSVCVLIIR
jgi:MFS-type transporter involved in bile tolerance (Atg22 family)